jgi:hypothetical protein
MDVVEYGFRGKIEWPGGKVNPQSAIPQLKGMGRGNLDIRPRRTVPAILRQRADAGEEEKNGKPQPRDHGFI